MFIYRCPSTEMNKELESLRRRDKDLTELTKMTRDIARGESKFNTNEEHSAAELRAWCKSNMERMQLARDSGNFKNW
jgi:hypothetical protein